MKVNKINYIKGDATLPNSEGNKIIAHICNDIGAWGKGFVLALSKRWREPEMEYKKWAKEEEKENFQLGEIQIVKVNKDTYVANMIAQKGIRRKNTNPPIRYEAVEQCLSKLSEEAKIISAAVHMPRIGCGLAGGQWELIEPLINKCLIQEGIRVFVYDFE